VTAGAVKKTSRHSSATLLLEFLGSMNLAITLLVTVGIASVIGTVLKQNEPYQNYVFKFGPFWFEIFNSLGLYDVYSAAWFLLILTFLVLSTSSCIYRNAPLMLHDMRSYRLGVRFNSLNAFHSKREWHLDASSDVLLQQLTPVVKAFGYNLRSKQHDDHVVVSAKKGAINRLGYLFTHSAIVIICTGGLLDGNLALKWRAFSGDISIETRDIPASEVPAESRLPKNNPSFRGSVSIAEGSSANLVFLNLRDGYLLQPLPFSVAVKDFRIEHYSSGQPKSFESDLVIHDPESGATLEKTIAVNHPLIYKGYAIYQASFSDGGSRLALRLWPLLPGDGMPQDVSSAVFEDISFATGRGEMTLELDNFRLFNINPVQQQGTEKELRNFGPNFSFKLRNELGEATEYENYMSPVEMNGRQYYLSGVRHSPNDPFQYLYIPATPDGGIERFMQFQNWLHDAPRIRELASATAQQSVSLMKTETPGFLEEVTNSMASLLLMFVDQGSDGVVAHVDASVPEAERANVLEAYLKVLQTMLASLYAELLTENGVDLSQGVSEQDSWFFDDAVNAIGAIGSYGSPFFIQLTSFEHIQSTGLQITKSPGKILVYIGFVLLIAGVFCMFYVAASRLWFWIDRQGEQTRLLLAGSGLRHQRDFEQQFSRLASVLDEQFRKS
jgi:cytochrome c biogenesis protein